MAEDPDLINLLSRDAGIVFPEHRFDEGLAIPPSWDANAFLPPRPAYRPPKSLEVAAAAGLLIGMGSKATYGS
jgi:hypothetical protein